MKLRASEFTVSFGFRVRIVPIFKSSKRLTLGFWGRDIENKIAGIVQSFEK